MLWANPEMKILYMGSLTSYVTQNDAAAFKSLGHDVSILSATPIPSNPIGGLVNSAKVIQIIGKDYYFHSLSGVLGSTITSALAGLFRRKSELIKRAIKENDFDMIFANWGSNMIPLVKIVQDMRLHIPIIYNFLSYPQNVYKWKVQLENMYCKKAIENLDVRIYSSENMMAYFRQEFNVRKRGLDIVLQPFFSEKYFCRERMPLLSETDGEPHVVFVGPTSLPWDDIRQQISRITEGKIHFHMVRPKAPIKEHAYLHFFPYFPLDRLDDGSLATFMTQFDACISTFNFEVCSCLDRFHTSYPSRFLFALNAGVPSVMPRGYLVACEDFVNKYHIGFGYSSVRQLKNKLAKRDFMASLRRNAINHMPDFAYKKNLSKMNKLMKKVVS